MDRYAPGISVAAGSMMLKWDLMDACIRNKKIKLQPGDEVNVFINFESIMNNIYSFKNLNYNLSYFKQDLVIELESAILNVVANYKAYFNKEKCNSKIYLYYTDIESEDQHMMIYNKYYRTYYRNKYLQNPKFRNMGEVLKSIIIPELILIMSYIPNIYFIKSKGFDSSLIPQIISNMDNKKNIIISGDLFDTLYMFNPNFINIFIKRNYKELFIGTEVDDIIQNIINNESVFDLNIFKSEMYYKLLLSINGSPIRNIRTNRNINYSFIIKALKEGIDNGIVLRDFESLSSIINIFPEKYRDEIKSAFSCMSIENQFELLTNMDIESIKNQIVDKIDITSVEALNNRRFLNYPINLQALLN